jgi:peptidoglycan/LPS O-acetylase OafA/YrhL
LTGSSFPSDDLCAFFRSFISFGRSAVWLAFAGSWAYFFYLGEYYTALTGKYSVLTSAWSLGVEEKFYLIWPQLVVRIGLSTIERGL